jgi:hypothetical protein
MFKKTVARLLLFGIPCGLSYWATTPAPSVAGHQRLVVCAYAGDRPGELRISLEPACSKSDNSKSAEPGSLFPAVNIPQPIEDHESKKSVHIPF